jgi:hypothetical protein
MSPYIISYLRECNKEVEIRYSTAVWMSLSNVGSLKIISLLTGFIFALKFNINMKLYIFLGCLIFRFVRFILNIWVNLNLIIFQFSGGIALTYFSIKISFLMTLLTFSMINGKFFLENEFPIKFISIVFKINSNRSRIWHGISRIVSNSYECNEIASKKYYNFLKLAIISFK